MARLIVLWIVATVVLWSLAGGLSTSAEAVILDQDNQAKTAKEKPSLVEAYPFVIIIFVLAGLVGVVISIVALRALWRARLYE